MKKAVGGNALVTIDDYGMLLQRLKTFQAMELADWRELFQREGSRDRPPRKLSKDRSW